MSYEPLSPEDAALLCATPSAAPLQIGAVCFFDAAPLRNTDGTVRLDDLRAHIDARLALSPRFRQRVVPVALDAARPVWLDDEQFDIAHHVKATVAPEPGGDEGLRRAIADLLSNPLDPRRPLWDAWVIDGLDDDRLALVLRVHHVIADGLSLLEAAMLFLDLEARDRPDRPGPWRPEPSPPTERLFVESLAGRARHQVELVARGVRGLGGLVDPRRILGGMKGGVSTLRSGFPMAPPLSMNAPTGTSREVIWSSLSMADVQEARRERGVTVNDVVLTLVAGGLRRWIGAQRSDRLADRPPRVVVPVGAFDNSGPEGGNTFSLILTDLPVAIEDPVERLDVVHQAMEERKAGGESSRYSSVFDVVDLLPIPLLRWLGPLALSTQPFVNLAVTNIPGSPEPLYLLGSRLRSVHPIVTGVGNLALIIGVLSYVDELGIGLTVDPDVVDDPDGLLEAIGEEAEELFRQIRRGGSS